ncbi:MAG: sigma-54-dependent Fis family transcriptional regulator [Acidobacteria bacterium]|nr:sigma-54-dependent Fis family transcriptional regulator [Acidobacteriota bacterium]
MRLLLVEDKDSFRRLLEQALVGSPFEVVALGDPLEALRALEAGPFDLLATDLRLPGLTGLELIHRAKRLQPGLRVVLMSAFAEARDIVEAMQAGADDFLPKPFELGAFLALLDRLRALASAPPPSPQEPWVAASPALKELDAALRKASEATVPVLFLGPRGAGKGRAARRLHVLRHPKAPYLSLASEALGPEGVPDSQRRLVAGGSLFLQGLDLAGVEAGEAIIRQMEEPGLRWMAGAIGAPGARLRERFGVLELRVPGLRERREDILPLFRLCLERACQREGRLSPQLDRASERELLEHPWPGNLRELEALALRTARFHRGPVIRGFRDLGLAEQDPLILGWPGEGSLETMEKEILRQAEERLLRRALERSGGDLPKAAEALELTVRVLGQRLRDHGIPIEG